MMENGQVSFEMVMVYKDGKLLLFIYFISLYIFQSLILIGPMEPDMRVSGKIIKLMERENSFMLMGMYLKVIFSYNIAGEWEDDKANGYGVYLHSNGAKYKGYWKDDL